jgi:hypothetical protein
VSYASPVRLAIVNALCLLRCWKIVLCVIFIRFSIVWIVHFDMSAKHNFLSCLDDLESEILVDFRTEFKTKSWHLWYGISALSFYLHLLLWIQIVLGSLWLLFHDEYTCDSAVTCWELAFIFLWKREWIIHSGEQQSLGEQHSVFMNKLGIKCWSNVFSIFQGWKKSVGHSVEWTLTCNCFSKIYRQTLHAVQQWQTLDTLLLSLWGFNLRKCKLDIRLQWCI